MDNICIDCRKSADCKHKPRADQWTVAGCSWFEADPIITNADRIRQMSDEELAEWLDAVSKSWYDEGYTKDDESPLMSGYPATANEWIAWLKSPVEEGEK